MQNLFNTGARATQQLKYFLILLIVLIIFSLHSFAQGDLLIYPKRIIFEDSKKSQVLNISNTGKDTVRYFISVVQIRMKEDGSFETLIQPDSAQYFADKYFRFFPRSIVLGPNESQTVKMQLVNSNQLTAGEYRSHLYFRAEPEKKPLGDETLTKDTGSISVKLVAVFGISIPVIIRTGEAKSSVSFSDISLTTEQDSIPMLKIAFHRTGEISVYGDISIDHISIQGKITRVGAAKGLAIYTPTPVRYFKLPLDKIAGVDYQKGKIHISYITQADAKSIKMAETELILDL
ncbi:MAG: hypothetical protein WKF35_09770 [Ferruginibacter sp.]